MKICVMGAGGLGGFFGGFLAAAGEDVSFIARGAHLDAIRQNGLTVTGQLGDRHIADAKATDDPEEIGPVDIVLFCVKNYGLEQAAEACRPLLKPGAAVISVLNGVDAPERLAALLGPGHAVAGLTHVPASIAAPGVIAHVGVKTNLIFGEADGAASPRLTRFRDACRAAGLEAEISPDIATALWAKFVGWSSVSAVACACRKPMGAVQATPQLLALFRDAVREAAQVGRAAGANLPEDIVEQMTGVLHSFPPETQPSMLTDLLRGNRIELETACGAIVRLGEQYGVDTPVHRTIYAALLPHIDG